MSRFEDKRVFERWRCSVGQHGESGRFYVSFPVSNGLVEYDEYYFLASDVYAQIINGDEYLLCRELAACYARRRDEDLIEAPGNLRGAPADGDKEAVAAFLNERSGPVFRSVVGTMELTEGARARGEDVPVGGHLVVLDGTETGAAKALVAEVRSLGVEWGLKFHDHEGHPEGFYYDYWYDGAWKVTYGSHGTSGGIYVVPEWFVAGHLGVLPSHTMVVVGKGFGARHYEVEGEEKTLQFMGWREVLYDRKFERYEVKDSLLGKVKRVTGSMASFLKPKNHPLKDTGEAAKAEDAVNLRDVLWRYSPGGVMSADGQVGVASFDRGHFTVRMGGEVMLVACEHGVDKSVAVSRSLPIKAQSRKSVRTLTTEEAEAVYTLMAKALPLMDNKLELD